MTPCWFCLLSPIIMLVVANGAPVIAAFILKRRLTIPVDFRSRFFDGYPIFGKSKTWRGIIVSMASVGFVASLLGLDHLLGVTFAFFAMLGDLFSSFVKRRLGMPESSKARVLDTVPESILPSVLLKQPLNLSWLEIVWIAVIFLVIDLYISPLLYKWHIRKRPY